MLEVRITLLVGSVATEHSEWQESRVEEVLRTSWGELIRRLEPKDICHQLYSSLVISLFEIEDILAAVSRHDNSKKIPGGGNKICRNFDEFCPGDEISGKITSSRGKRGKCS